MKRFVFTARMLVIAALLLAGSVQPGLAAAPGYVVDDAGTNCVTGSGASDYATVQAAIDAAKLNNVHLIKICPGDYEQQLLSIDGVTNLKLIAANVQDKPRLTQPPATIGGGPFIHITDSTMITLDSLFIDGSNFADTSADQFGIRIVNSSVTIQNSVIAHFRDAAVGSGPEHSYGILAMDINLDGKTSPLSIKNTAILNTEHYGVSVSGAVKVTIAGSLINGEDGTGETRLVGVTAASTSSGQPSLTVSKTSILGHDYSLNLRDISKASINGNTLEGILELTSNCAMGSNANNNSNKIMKNMISHTNVAVSIDMLNSGACSPVASMNQISSNTITVNTTSPAVFILNAEPQAGAIIPTITNTKITGNKVWTIGPLLNAFNPGVTGTMSSGNKIYP